MNRIVPFIPETVEPESTDASPARGNPFPTEALPEPMRSMVRHAAQQTNAPESMCAAAGLGTVAASLGSSCCVQSGPGRQTPGNVFLAVIAGSGTGKGQAQGVMNTHHRVAGQRMMEEWLMEERPRLLAELETANADLDRGKKERRTNTSAQDAASAEETIKEAMKRKAAAESALAREPLLNIGNATAEAIVEALANAPGEASAIISSEARDIVDNLLGRYSSNGKGSDEAIFLQAYSGDPVIHKRKGKEALVLHKPHLTLSLSFQEDVWERVAGDSRLMESGFLARTMAFNSYAPPMRPSVYTIPEDIAAAWGRVIEALLHHRQNPEPKIVVSPTGEAQKILDDLANESADKREKGGEWTWCSSFAARLAENAWRLALVFHMTQHPQDAGEHRLDGETAAAAVRVARWFFTETLALLSPTRSQKTAARMERLITIFRDKRVSSMPVWQLASNHGFQESELAMIAAEFPQRIKIISEPSGPKGGRPSTSVKWLK